MGENRKVLMTRLLLSEALMSLLKEKHITQISISELCLKANVNRTTFYKYYSNVLDLLNEIENKILDTLNENINILSELKNLSDMLIRLEALFDYIKANKHTLSYLLTDASYHDFQSKLIAILYEKIDDRFSVSLVKDKELFIYIVSGSIAIVQNWIKSNYYLNSNQIANKILLFANKLIN